eukprot:TRINITY_DN51668_c0_g1_i1.p1 TRINITY_DN51668_c0_g1~~TRINITY_DN51668_c0_g1_i1.p1  ORF type:complete len:788 (+),score=133.85 TRINITY_DN51668_c0_g1_i1:290-2365(+)
MGVSSSGGIGEQFQFQSQKVHPQPSRQSTQSLTESDSLKEGGSLSTAEPLQLQDVSSKVKAAVDPVIDPEAGLPPGSAAVMPAAILETSTENDELQDLVSRLEDMFDSMDLDCSGTINRVELRKAFQEVGIPAIPAIEAFIDNTANMEIDRLEWLHMIEDASNQAPDEFKVFAKKLIDVQSEKGSILSESKKPTCPSFIIRHDSKTRMLWDMVMMVLLFWVCITMPLTMGFGAVSRLSDIDRVSDALFLTDVLLNFRTTYINKDDQLVKSGRKMALHYLKTWFVLDFVSSVPWDTVTAGVLPNLQSAKLLKVGKIAKVFKLLRLGKMIRAMASSELLEMIEDQFSPKASQTLGRVVNLVLVTFVACHWLACFLAVFDDGAIGFYLDSVSGNSESFEERYLAALYWAVTTLTTVGYGDVTPKSHGERGYVMLAMVIGSAFYGYVIGCITSVITDMDIDKRKFNERMDVVQAWLDFHERMPAILRRRIRRHFKEHYRNRTIADDSTIVTQLAGVLRADTAYFIIHEKVRTNPVFRGLPGSALASLVCVLKKTYAKSDENIVIKGDPGTSMYVIIEGQAQVIDGQRWVPPEAVVEGKHNLCKDLDEGDSFGEEIIFSLEQDYQYTVVAKTSVSMYDISMDDFKHQFRNMPELLQKMLWNFLRSRKNMLRIGWKLAGQALDKSTTLRFDSVQPVQ